MMNTWPKQRDVSKFYGPVGKNQVMVTPPYPMVLYDGPKKITRMSLHAKVAPSAMRVLQRVLDEYGIDKIQELHLDRYFGSLNVRKMRGSNSWSMHSWGIAIDFDANRNQLNMHSDRAAFAKPAYEKWWKAWEDEGWVSLGRARNYDWMHVQAARL